MSFLELLAFIGLLLLALAVSGWLGRWLGVARWALVLPVLLVAFYALRGIVTWLQVRADSARSHERRGHVYFARRWYDGAIEEFTQALAKAPTSPGSVYLWRGLSHQRRRDYERAIQDLGQAIALLPDSAEAYLHRALVHEEQEHHREALDDLNRALSCPHWPAAVQYHKAVVHEQLGEPGEALAAYEAFIKIARPDDPRVRGARERMRQLQAK